MPATTAQVRQSRSASTQPEPSFAEQVCLALIVQGTSHGWALGTMLAPDGELGRVWSLSRPLTYRAIDGLVAQKLVTRKGPTAGRGRDRVVLAATAAGRRAAAAWLDTPVTHLRDVRTELLVKLTFRERAGLGNEPLLGAQQAAFAARIDALTSTGDDQDVVDLWRSESARAVRRFLDRALRPAPPAVSGAPGHLALTARNQLRGTVTAVQHSGVMSTIKAVLSDGQRLTAAITRDAADDLDLAPGDAVVMIVKSTEVMVAKTG